MYVIIWHLIFPFSDKHEDYQIIKWFHAKTYFIQMPRKQSGFYKNLRSLRCAIILSCQVFQSYLKISDGLQLCCISGGVYIYGHIFYCDKIKVIVAPRRVEFWHLISNAYVIWEMSAETRGFVMWFFYFGFLEMRM